MNKKFKIVLVILIALLILSGLIILFTNNRKATKLDNNYHNSENEKTKDENDNSNLDVDDKTDSEINEEKLDKNDKVEENKKDESSLDKNKDNNESSNSNKDDKKEDNKVDNSTTNKPSQNGNTNQTNQNSQNNQNNQNNQIPSKDEGNNTTGDKGEDTNKEDDKKEEVTTPDSPKDENDIYRKKIESTYGVTIKYGDEIGDYKPKRLTPTKLKDSNKIKENLGYIETEFKKYPTEFFKDFKGMPLTIYLVESVPNNSFTGYTDREFMNDIKITVVNSYFFSYTLNHEIMHYIDAYLEIKMYPNDPYQEYMKLNPSGFVYGNAQEKYNYGYNSQIKGSYFLNSYSQLNPREDRAEIFKQMITRPYKPVGMFDEGEVIRKKALVISEQIKTYFPSAKGTQYWDKIIG